MNIEDIRHELKYSDHTYDAHPSCSCSQCKIGFVMAECNRYKKFAGDAIKLLKEIEWRNDDCNQCVCCLGFEVMVNEFTGKAGHHDNCDLGRLIVESKTL